MTTNVMCVYSGRHKWGPYRWWQWLTFTRRDEYRTLHYPHCDIKYRTFCPHYYSKYHSFCRGVIHYARHSSWDIPTLIPTVSIHTMPCVYIGGRHKWGPYRWWQWLTSHAVMNTVHCIIPIAISNTVHSVPITIVNIIVSVGA